MSDRAAAVRGRGHARRPRRPHHLHADGLDRDRRRGDGRGPGGDQAGSASGTAPARAGSTRRRPKGAQEAHESIRPTSFARDPESLRAHLKPEEYRLYRLIWQRAIASQMAPKELETTTVELAAGDVPAAGLGDADAVRRLRPGLHRGPGRRRRRGGGAHAAAARRGRRHARLDVTPTQHFTEPPPRFTEATLIKALEEHGIGRPSTYAATISTIVDRGYVRIEERRLHPEEIGEIVTDLLVEHFGEYVDLEFTARMEEELDEVAHGERAWVPLLREFFEPLKMRVDEKRKELKRADFTTEATDEVCSLGPPDGDPPRAQRAVPRLLDSTPSTRRRGRCRARRPPKLEGEGEPAPSAAKAPRRPSAASSARSWAARATRTATSSSGRAAAARPAAVRGRLPQERRRAPRGASRAAHRQRLLGVLRLPKCDFTTNDEPTGAIHDVHADGKGAIARRGEAGLCLTCGATVAAARGRPRRAAAGGRPAESRGAGAAGARRRRRRRRGERAAAGGRRDDAARRSARRGAGDRVTGADRRVDRVRARSRLSRCRRRDRRRRAPPVPPLARGPRHLAPHPALVRDDRHRLPRLARGPRRGLAGARAARRCARTSRSSPRATPGRRSRSGSPRSARSTGTRPRGPRAGRPVGRDRDAAPAAPPAAGPRGRPGRGLLAVVDDDLDRVDAARRPDDRHGRAARPRPRAGDRAARPGARRDGVRGRPPDQRARRGRPRRARPAARRAARARQGPQGADRAAGPAGARGARGYLDEAGPSLRRAGARRARGADRPRCSSTTRARRSASAACGAASTGCGAARACRRASARTRCATASRPTCSRAARTCGSCRSCWATRASRRRRSTRTSRRPACARRTGGAPAGPGDVMDDPTTFTTRRPAGTPSLPSVDRGRRRGRPAARRSRSPGPGSSSRGVPRVAGPRLRALRRDRRGGAGRRASSTRSSRRSGSRTSCSSSSPPARWSSAMIPVVAGPPRDPRGGPGLARRVDRDDADARALALLAGVVLLFAPGLVASITPGFDAARARADHRADADHGAGAAVPRGRRGGDERPQRPGRFGAAALAPLVYNLAIIGGALVLVPAVRGRGPRPRRRLGAAGHLLVQCRRCAGSAPGSAAARPGRPAGAEGAAADGAAGARPRRHPDRVPRHDEPRVDARRRARSRLQLRVRDPPDPDRRDRRAARRRPAAVAVARGGDRRQDAFRHLLVRGLSMLGLRDDRDRGARDRRLQDIVQLLFGFVAMGQAALDATGRRSPSSSSGSPRTR